MSELPLRPSLPVITYHTLGNGSSPVTMTVDEFRRQMEQFAAGGWRTLSVDDAVAGLANGGWPSRTMLLTFDDAYASVMEHAFPILERHRFTATIFVVSDCVGSTHRWPWQPASIQETRLMSWADLKDASSAGHALGAHSRSHAELPKLSMIDAESEIAGSRQAIEDRCGVPVTTFAYPYGSRSAAVEAIAGQHFRAAFGTELAFVTAASNPMRLERLDSYYLRGWPSRMARDIDGPVSRSYFGLRRVGRALRERWS